MALHGLMQVTILGAFLLDPEWETQFFARGVWTSMPRANLSSQNSDTLVVVTV